VLPKPGKFEYEKVGRDLVEAVRAGSSDLYNLRRIMWVNFVKGVFAGFGGVIGATLMVGLLLFILEKVGGHLPLVGPWLESLGRAIQQGPRP
jgi:hypothetical protein